MRKLKVNKSKFLDWYGDDDLRTAEDFAFEIFRKLKKKEKVEVTMRDVETGYLPIRFIENKEVLTKDELEEGEVEEPDFEKEIEWV
jgi:hypothetical protein